MTYLYLYNEVAAGVKYTGKTVLVTGTINQIDKTLILGDPYIDLSDENNEDAVRAFFSSGRSSEFMNIMPGQSVKILGTCRGKSSGRIKLTDCRIIN